MDTNAKITLLEHRLNQLVVSGKEKQGVQQKMRRKIQKLKQEKKAA